MWILWPRPTRTYTLQQQQPLWRDEKGNVIAAGMVWNALPRPNDQMLLLVPSQTKQSRAITARLEHWMDWRNRHPVEPCEQQVVFSLFHDSLTQAARLIIINTQTKTYTERERERHTQTAEPARLVQWIHSVSHALLLFRSDPSSSFSFSHTPTHTERPILFYSLITTEFRCAPRDNRRRHTTVHASIDCGSCYKSPQRSRRHPIWDDSGRNPTPREWLKRWHKFDPNTR